MTVKSKAIKAIPYSMAITFLEIIVSLFGMVLLVRYLEAYEYGVYAILSGLPTMIELFISLGYDQYLFRYIPSIEDKRKVGYIVWHIILRRLFFASVVGAALILSFHVYDENFGLEGFFLHFLFYQIIVVFHLGNAFFKKAFLARFSQRIVFNVNTIFEISRVVIIYIGINQSAHLLFFIKGFIISELLCFIVFAFVFIRQYYFPSLPSLIKPRYETKEEKSYNRASFIDKLGGSFLGTDIDRYILAYFSNTTQVAIYAIAARILGKLIKFYPHRMFKNVIESALYSQYDATQKDSDLNKAFSLVYNANNLVGFFFLAIFIPLGSDMIQLIFKQDYTTQAYFPLMIFLLFLIFNSVPLNMVVRALKKPRILIISKISIILNIMVGIPLAYKFGAAGMAVATATSQLLQNYIIYALINKYIPVHVPWLSTIKSIINCGITVAALVFLNQYVSGFLVLKIILGCSLYVLIAKINSIFSAEETKVVVSLVPKKLQKLATFIV